MRLRPCLHREGTKEGESYNEKKKKKNNENLKGYRRHQYIYLKKKKKRGEPADQEVRGEKEKSDAAFDL